MVGEDVGIQQLDKRSREMQEWLPNYLPFMFCWYKYSSGKDEEIKQMSLNRI